LDDDGVDAVANRPAVVVEGEEVRYRASSLGSCTRALAAARQELEPYRGALPGRVAEVFERGHKAEEVGIGWLNAHGYAVTDRQRETVVQLTPRLKIVGHIDCIIQHPREGTRPSIVDVKSQSEEEFANPSIKNSAFWPRYVWQFGSYQVGLQMPMAVLRVCGDEAVLEHVDTLPDRAMLLSRVLQVEALARADLRGVSCDRDDYPCPYFRLLHDNEYEEREDGRLADLALHYNRLGVEIEPLERRRKEIRQELIKELGSGARIRETTSGIEVRVTTAEVKERYIPAGSMVRLSVRLPREAGEEGVARSDDA